MASRALAARRLVLRPVPQRRRRRTIGRHAALREGLDLARRRLRHDLLAHRFVPRSPGWLLADEGFEQPPQRSLFGEGFALLLARKALRGLRGSKRQRTCRAGANQRRHPGATSTRPRLAWLTCK
jgi:hypothetical protein